MTDSLTDDLAAVIAEAALVDDAVPQLWRRERLAIAQAIAERLEQVGECLTRKEEDGSDTLMGLWSDGMRHHFASDRTGRVEPVYRLRLEGEKPE